MRIFYVEMATPEDGVGGCISLVGIGPAADKARSELVVEDHLLLLSGVELL